MPPIVEVSQLTKRFGAKTAVDGISFSIAPGEAVGLLGPNGAGKTTTLMTMLGAVTADGGSITIDGHPMPSARSQAMESVGFAAGYLPMPGRLSVRQALLFFARLAGVAKPGDRVDSVLARLGISHLADDKADTLSSGQRTLAGIAKAMVHRPKLLVLDEPTASLDPDVADRVRSAISDLHTEGVSLLITSHDMAEVERLCERVLFLQNGRIIADDKPQNLAAAYGMDDLTGVFIHIAREDRS